MPNAKRKGNKFERAVAKFFTTWTGFEFARTPGSGSYHSNKDLTSDVSCIDEKHAHRCKINIECKSYKDIRFEQLMLTKFRKHCKILEFWEQACRDAERSNRVPILCMRYNSMPSDEFFFVVDERLAIGTTDMQCMCLTLKDSLNLFIFLASEIKNNIEYKHIHKLAKAALR